MPIITRSRSKQENVEGTKSSKFADLLAKVWLLFTDPAHFCTPSGYFVLGEIFLCSAIIWKVPYTEIDWVTYMQQVDCFLNGTLDYAQIGGDTGPLPYPAGHLYLYTILHFVTDAGKRLRLAQYIFMIFYVVTLLLVIVVYRKAAKVPAYVLFVFCCTSYRVHSIFILRLFNDPLAVMFFYAALVLWLYGRWTLGCIIYSVAVSIKMNILLFAPALFVILLLVEGRFRTLIHIINCALVQLTFALPFLLTHPVSYISRSFNLGRIFLFKWTVNWRFLPESIFVDKRWHLVLLFAHLAVLVAFASCCWFRKRGGMWKLLKANRKLKLSANDILFPLMTANFVGVALSRTLHYQFFVWYYHSLPFLLWSTRYPAPFKLAIVLLIEIVWNVYPSTVWSSAVLHLMHGLILVGIWLSANDRKVHPE